MYYLVKKNTSELIESSESKGRLRRLQKSRDDKTDLMVTKKEPSNSSKSTARSKKRKDKRAEQYNYTLLKGSITRFANHSELFSTEKEAEDFAISSDLVEYKINKHPYGYFVSYN